MKNGGANSGLGVPDCCQPAISGVAQGSSPPSSSSRRNVVLLAAAQGFNLIAWMTWVAFSSLAGHLLGGDGRFAALPVTLSIAATASSVYPLSCLMQRRSRRFVFLLGALLSSTAGLMAASAMFLQSYFLLLAAALLLGIQLGASQYYRYAAAESVEASAVPRAVAMVLLGGVIAAALAVPLQRLAERLAEPLIFAGAFFLIALSGLLAILPLAFLVSVDVKAEKLRITTGNYREFFSKPGYRLALAGGVVAAAAMTGLMTSAPLAMVACGFQPGAAASAVQWHVLAMFVPGFVSGRMIQRFGERKMMLAGLFFIASAAMFCLTGTSIVNFGAALVLIGIGWNFLFISSTSLLTRQYLPEERMKAQGIAEFCIYSGAALASLLSGALVSFAGWPAAGAMVLVLTAAAGINIWRYRGAVERAAYAA